MRRIFVRMHRYRYRCVRTGREIGRETKDGAKNTTGAGVCAIASWQEEVDQRRPVVHRLRHAAHHGLERADGRV